MCTIKFRSKPQFSFYSSFHISQHYVFKEGNTEDIGNVLVNVSVDLWHNCTQFTLFRLNVAEAVYSSIVSYWGHKLSRQHSLSFSPSRRPHKSNCFAQYIGLYLPYNYQLWHHKKSTFMQNERISDIMNAQSCISVFLYAQ